MNRRSFNVSCDCRIAGAIGLSSRRGFQFTLNESETPSRDIFWNLIHQKGFEHIHGINWFELPCPEEQLSS